MWLNGPGPIKFNVKRSKLKKFYFLQDKEEKFVIVKDLLINHSDLHKSFENKEFTRIVRCICSVEISSYMYV